MNRLFSNKKYIFILVFPGLLLFSFAVFLPILVSIYYGTMDWDGLGKPVFIGTKNFTDILFHDPDFFKSLLNALILGLALVFIQHPICMGVALMLDKLGGKLEKVFRVIMFIPCVISVVVTCSMWVNIYNPDYGLLNKLLDIFHLSFLKHAWLGDTKTVLGSVIFIVAWQGFGYGMLIYYAGVKGLPEDVYEAARIDGASGIKQFTSMTFPLLKPVIRVNVTLAVISAFKQMETVYLTTGGGPGNTSQFLANYLYKQAFTSYRYGYGNAISVLFVIVCLLATVLLDKILNRTSID
jgi:raffinose/stachyose/melibiose transport system permease protein